MDETIDIESAHPEEVEEAPTTSRRHLFAMGAAAVAGATIADVLVSGSADAATGGPVVIGGVNTVSLATDSTTLTGSFSVTDNDVLPNRVAITGTQSVTNTNAHFGVQGVSHSSFSSLVNATLGAGVLGTHDGGGPGLMGQSAGNGPQLQLLPGNSGSPPAFPQTGQFYVGNDGLLHFCFGGGAFTPLNSVVPLPTPVRVINTVSGVGGIVGPLAAGAAIHTSSALTGANGIPTNAVGLVGNFAISGVGGALLNGFGVATIFPAGAATPATANINAGAGCFAISNSATVAFGTGLNAGKVSIVWGGGGPVPNAEAFFDVIAYII
jgi:hypothetical protein